MIIQIDTREKDRAIKQILKTFKQNGVRFYQSKLYVGDYMNLDNPRTIIDRKQNLSELCGNVCQQHDRFRNELMRAKEAKIHLIILVEHGKDVSCLEDVIFWENPRLKTSPKAMTGETLYKILLTMERKYGVQYEFCDKRNTGTRILELLE